MVSLRDALSRVLLVGALAVPAAAALFVPSDASASVSIAIPFDVLVKDADVVAVITPGEASSVWEDGRIYTYTKVHVDEGVAGDVGAGADGWVRTMGGVVGKIGQMVDGEPVFVENKSSLLFLRKMKTGAGLYEVSARAQGQYPVVIDAKTKERRIIRSTAVGLLLPPKAPITEKQGPSVSSSVQTQSAGSGGQPLTEAAKIRLAQEVIHDRPLAEASREIAAAWKRLHPTATAK